MNPKQLLQHFDRLSEAPDALPRLRRFILDLAVRGKLVEQDPDDEPASELIKRIRAEKTRLVKEGQMKKDKDIQSMSIDDQPFKLPENWEFVRLGTVLIMINGRAFKPTDWLADGLPIVRIQNLNNLKSPFNYCDPSTIDERHLIKDEDFLISWSGTPGTSFGAFIWKRGIAALNQHIFRCIQIGSACNPEFLRLAINSQLDVLISQAQGGVGLQHVTKGTLENLPIPLPPLAEQHRIVAKVDELMALCDQLEAAKTKREQNRERLVAASLQRLNDVGQSRHSGRECRNPEHKDVSLSPESALPSDWMPSIHDGMTDTDSAGFFLGNLPRLTTRPAHIKQLRQTLLNLAVRGKLVEQDPNDEPVSELIKRIRAEKARLVKDGQMKKDKDIQSVSIDDQPFKLQKNWQFVRLGTVLIMINGRAFKPTDWLADGLPIVRIQNLNNPKSPFNYCDPSTIDERHLIKDEDFLISWSGTPGTSFGAFIWKRGVAALNQHIFRCIQIGSAYNPEFLRLSINSQLDVLISQAQGGVGLQHVTKGTLENLPIPLPPLAEQHRIVAKVDELMALCDQLETQLTTTAADSRRLLEAVLHEALNPARKLAA